MEAGLPHNQHMLDVMSNLLLFFGIAGLAVPLLQRLRMSSILAYLLCGILIGPYGITLLPTDTSWIDPFVIREFTTINLLGELGIVALMFMIGLELSLDRLRELKRFVLGLGSAQILVTATAIFLVAICFPNSLQASVLIGASLALSSTAIVMHMLEENRHISKQVGVLCFSILLMQDLAVVPIIVLVGAFSGSQDGNVLMDISSALGIGFVTIALMYVLGRKLLRPLLSTVSASRNPEWLSAITVFVVVGCAVITQYVGLSLALGAFMAGMLIAETEFRHEIEIIVSPLKGLLLGIFFLSIGMMIDIREVLREPLYLFLSVVGIYSIKAIILFPLCTTFRISGRNAAQVAVMLAQPGEFALLILSAALAAGVLPQQDGQFFLLVTALAMMCSPLLFKIAPRAGELAGRLFPEMASVGEINKEDREYILLVGFGRVGQQLGSILEDQNLSYLAVDHNPALVQELRKDGYNVVFGDARKTELWQKIHNGSAIAAVIAIDSHDISEAVLKSLRSEWPLLPVVMRSKDTAEVVKMYEMGAKYVVAETLESSLRIARLVMEEIGMEQEHIEREISRLWEQNSAYVQHKKSDI